MVPMLLAWLVALLPLLLLSQLQVAQTTGTASVTVVLRGCSPGAAVDLHAKMLSGDASVDRTLTLNDSTFRTSDLPPGRYYMFARSGSCAARFLTAIFPGITSDLVLLMRGVNEIQESPDYYIVPFDALALRLPFRHLSVTASMEDGKPLDAQVDGDVAFIDDVPPGDAVIKVWGANFFVADRFRSHAANASYVHEIRTSSITVAAYSSAHASDARRRSYGL